MSVKIFFFSFMLFFLVIGTVWAQSFVKSDYLADIEKGESEVAANPKLADIQKEILKQEEVLGKLDEQAVGVQETITETLSVEPQEQTENVPDEPLIIENHQQESPETTIDENTNGSESVEQK